MVTDKAGDKTCFGCSEKIGEGLAVEWHGVTSDARPWTDFTEPTGNGCMRFTEERRSEAEEVKLYLHPDCAINVAHGLAGDVERSIIHHLPVTQKAKEALDRAHDLLFFDVWYALLDWARDGRKQTKRGT